MLHKFDVIKTGLFNCCNDVVHFGLAFLDQVVMEDLAINWFAIDINDQNLIVVNGSIWKKLHTMRANEELVVLDSNQWQALASVQTEWLVYLLNQQQNHIFSNLRSIFLILFWLRSLLDVDIRLKLPNAQRLFERLEPLTRIVRVVACLSIQSSSCAWSRLTAHLNFCLALTYGIKSCLVEFQQRRSCNRSVAHLSNHCNLFS